MTEATEVRANDVRIGDRIDIGAATGTPGEAWVRVAQIRTGRDGTVSFYEQRRFSDRVDLFLYSRPNVTIRVSGNRQPA